MNATTLPTPVDLTITPRDRRFGREEATPRLWHGGRVEATAIYNALSTTFPAGEAFFVESVRAFREGAPPKLAEEIKGFTTQEAIHSREHDAFNRRAADAGYDLSKLETAGRIPPRRHPRRSRRSSASRRPWRSSISPPSSRTSCSPIRGISQGADHETAELWRWHACEEIEHKGVAYDTWLFATRNCAAAQAPEAQGQGDARSSPATSSSTAPPARSS